MIRPLNACLSAGLPKKAAGLSSSQSLYAGEGWPPICATQPSVVFLWPWFCVQEEARALHPFPHLSLLLTGLWKILLFTPISDCRLSSTQMPLQNPWFFSERAHADLTPPILEVRGPSLFIFVPLRAQHELHSLELHKCLLGKSWKEEGGESRYQCSCHSRVPEKGITRRL